MTKVSIIGATGYTGEELIRICLAHPEVEIVYVAAKVDETKRIDEFFPHFKGHIDLVCGNLNVDEAAKDADVIFLALPHKVSMSFVPEFLDKGKKVIDLSADYRFESVDTYERWYEVKHTSSNLLEEAVYGLCELYADEIKGGRLVANPGCYPTSAILGIAPFVKSKVVEPYGIVVDSKSGVSGAGRNPNMKFHYPECSESVKAYSLVTHRHTPEISKEVSKIVGKKVRVIFAPHLVPMQRGILGTIYMDLKKKLKDADVSDVLKEFYAGKHFVRVLEVGQLPETRNVKGTNYCDIGYKIDENAGKLIVVSCIDNLIKGASGQAVQNMNIMMGWDETLGLKEAPVFP